MLRSVSSAFLMHIDCRSQEETQSHSGRRPAGWLAHDDGTVKHDTNGCGGPCSTHLPSFRHPMYLNVTLSKDHTRGDANHGRCRLVGRLPYNDRTANHTDLKLWDRATLDLPPLVLAYRSCKRRRKSQRSHTPGAAPT